MLARSLVKDVKREEGSPVVILRLERERERETSPADTEQVPHV